METSEKFGKDAHYPKDGDFAALLNWHLNRGTRPNAHPERPGRRWSSKEFAGKVGLNERVVRNWRADRNRPNDLTSIERELFGDSEAHDAWRQDLRTVYDGKVPAGQTEPPPLLTAHFLGREKDVSAILRALLDSPAAVAVMVQGGPGIGKTTLTHAIAAHTDIIRRFGADNRWFVKLETAATTAAMQDAIMRSLGCDPGRGFKAALLTLRDRQGLLILDNLETPWDLTSERRDTEDTLAGLAALPGLALLASFRGRERVAGPPWALVHSLAQLEASAAEKLFCRVSGRTFPKDQFLAEFTKALGGVPLAIELVANRAYGETSLAELWKQWTELGAFLAEHTDFGRDRLTSLPHSIELSLKSSRMTDGAMRLFRLLGQLPAGLAPQDREALLGKAAFQADESLRRIGLAVARDGRLDLLPPIREYAARRQYSQAEALAAWPEHYLNLTRRLGETIGTTADEGAVARLQPDLPNLDAAFQAMLRAGRREEAMASLAGFGRLTLLASWPSPMLRELAASCHEAGDILGEANSIMSLGDVALRRSDHDAAQTAYEQALPLHRKVGDVFGEANCIKGLGDIALRRSDHDAAQTAYKQALPLHRQVGDLIGEANCNLALGHIALRRSDHDDAQTAFEHALLLYRKIGGVLGEANCIRSLGTIALVRSDYDVAQTAFEQALSLHQKVGDMLGEANCIKSLGSVAIGRSDHETARIAFQQAVPLYRKVGDVLGEANCIWSLGNIALARSNHKAARTAFERALPLYRQIGAAWGETACLEGLKNLS